MSNVLPPIPHKRYFTIGEVSELCAVKSHVLRYWEQEFSQLKPMKRSGNRRYYQHHEVLLIRRIRELLYDQGFTISGARNKLGHIGSMSSASLSPFDHSEKNVSMDIKLGSTQFVIQSMADVRAELLSICRLLEDSN